MRNYRPFGSEAQIQPDDIYWINEQSDMWAQRNTNAKGKTNAKEYTDAACRSSITKPQVAWIVRWTSNTPDYCTGLPKGLKDWHRGLNINKASPIKTSPACVGWKIINHHTTPQLLAQALIKRAHGATRQHHVRSWRSIEERKIRTRDRFYRKSETSTDVHAKQECINF
jgi:hypothetical protein